MASYTPSATYTDNPFVDLLLYYSKLLAYKAVIKNEDNALESETVQSLELGDLLIACTEKTITFSVFWQRGYFSASDYIEAGIAPMARITSYMQTENNIGLRTMESDIKFYPELVNQMATMTEKARLKFLDEYTEYNNYYRMLCGKPDIGDYGVPIKDYEYNINEMNGYRGTEGNVWGAVYVHDIPTDGCKELESAGILDQIRSDYPQYPYLEYMACGITPYIARKAYDFQLLYTPDISDTIIADRFMDKYEDNRTYVMNAFYTDAFKLSSPYYSNFIEMLIILLTITDILSEVQSDIVKLDILDRRCVQYIFEMYGVPYYKSIPLLYQKRICKNLNKLIRDKSSAQCMVDIINLFGAENIEIFKYYMVRDRAVDSQGNHVYNTIKSTKSETNDVLIYESVPIDNATSMTTIPIPFPFENYLGKGNKMVVRIGDTILEQDTTGSGQDAPEPMYIYHTITITQTDNQLITVTCNGNEYTSTFKALENSKWTATIVADDGYKAGTLSGTSGSLTKDITITATLVQKDIETTKDYYIDIDDNTEYLDAIDVQDIISGAYQNNNKLSMIYFPSCKTIDFAAFFGCTRLAIVNLANVTSIGSDAFSQCSALVTLNLPKVTTLGDSTFYNCAALTNINLPSVTTIEDSTFLGCSLLTDVRLPKVKTLKTQAFRNCISLKTIQLPAVNSIGSNAFTDCLNVSEIHFAAANKSAITSASGYSNKFGATNATIYFDL